MAIEIQPLRAGSGDLGCTVSGIDCNKLSGPSIRSLAGLSTDEDTQMSNSCRFATWLLDTRSWSCESKPI